MTISKIPAASLAFIGGSGTFSLDFPADLKARDVEIPDEKLVFETPFGISPEFQLLKLGSNNLLTVKMHGRIPGVSWAESAKRTFWVLREAGVKRILTEAGVGSVNHLLDPGDLIIADDYIDQSLRKDVHLTEDYLSIMRQPLCPDLRRVLIDAAGKLGHSRRLFQRGTYLVTDGRHFESAAEIRAFQQWGADIVGQNLCPEVYLAREIGACYAGIYLIVNYGEGVVEPWQHKILKDMFYNAALPLGEIVLEALRGISLTVSCSCQELRRPTLLRKEHIGLAEKNKPYPLK